jgi:trans-L-3-hydroxyproline dehydratase
MRAANFPERFLGPRPSALKPQTSDPTLTVITTIESHAAGEPLRIVTAGIPPLPGDTILARRRYMRDHLDHLRRAIMWEPRGHFDMYGAVLTPPVTPEARFGVLFVHNEGYSTMCGHGVIALVTALVETGRVSATPPRTEVGLDTPAGLVRATAHHDASGRVERVSFLNVPSFVYRRDLTVDVAAYGRMTLDIAFGGAFYAFVNAGDLGLDVEPRSRDRLVAAADAITAAVNASVEITHPSEPDLGFLYGTILVGDAEDSAHHSRNVCVFARSEVDRSPTGTGVSARAAIHVARGELDVGHEIAIESILGRSSVFRVKAVERTRVGEHEAIVPEVSGRGFITGRCEFALDPTDPLGAGFLIA